MSRDWPHTLLTPPAFPHAVDRLQLIETHISWVILTGEFSYKLKKPLDLGFLDFTTLEQRRYYCERELTLNRRFAHNLYLDVVPVTGTPEAPHIGGDGAAIDYAVKMRQFDNDQLADHLAQTGRLSDSLIHQMARTLARIHNDLPSVDPDSGWGTAEDFRAGARENFAQIGGYAPPKTIQASLEVLQQWTDTRYQQTRSLLERRRREGFVKDCHGDCHLGNIVVLDGEVTLFDCIEFNDSFRIRDTMAEAAFLSMDLCARGRPQQSQLFLNTYLEYRGDYGALALLQLFRCYYALVRAKVNLMREAQTDTEGEFTATHPDFCHYVALARRFTAPATPGVILMHGLSGSGKSYLAERVAARLGAIRIRSDVERKRLYNLSPEQSGDEEPALYSQAASRKTFEHLLQLCQSIVDAGFICIVDATFLAGSARAPFAQWARKAGVPWAILHCEASEATILQRLQRRTTEGGDPSDADSTIYHQQKTAVEPFDADEMAARVVADTEHEDCIDRAVAALEQRLGSRAP